MAHELPKLPYDFAALEPHIDAKTMQIHHGKHHATYVTNLNAALEPYPALQEKSAEDLIKDLAALPDAIRTAVRNNGGGHVNHTMFWQIMGGTGNEGPYGRAKELMDGTFGGFEKFKAEFKKAALGRFGSGWAWLVKSGSGFAIESTANQDNPMMEGKTPIFGIDVWEHAYYLNYQNRRADYVDAWWNVVNWNAINERLK